MRDAIRMLGRGFATTLLSLLCGGALQACFASHGPNDSTETGNPPFVDSKRVSLRVSADGVHITGDKGAVTPGGAAIEITNLTTGKVTKATAAADGSFDVQVDGAQDDVFVVRINSSGKTSTPIYVVHGGVAAGSGNDGSLSCAQRQQLAGAQLALAAADADKQCMVDLDCQAVLEDANCLDTCEFAVVSQAGQRAIEATGAVISAGLCSPADGCVLFGISCAKSPIAACVAGQCQAAGSMQAPGTLSCMERDQMAGQQVAAAVDAADKSCMVDSDCGDASTSTSCHDSCGPVVASHAGQAAIAAAVSGIERDVCGSFTADGCSFVALPCAPVPMGAPACSNGKCTYGMTSTTGPAACPGCLAETIEWGPSNANAGFVAYRDHSKLEPCVHYTRTRVPSGDPSTPSLRCDTDLMACNSSASVGAVETALSSTDVKQALAGNTPVLYGVVPTDGAPFEVTVGLKVIDVGSACNGQQGCTEIPAGVRALVDELMSVDQQLQTPSLCPAFAAASDPGACPPDRKLATVCTMCGLGGGCSASVQTCAKVCSTSTDCAGDVNGQFCSSQQVCEQGGCI